MPDATDQDLLQEFAHNRSETAFAGLVSRHINLVHSVALRRTGNPEDAQDVTQAVFLILAQKAASLRKHTALTGWLYRTTRFAAAKLLRTKSRRLAREQEAYMQSTLEQTDSASVWQQLAPYLEAGMDRLGERDRTLLALRYYENKSGAEAAAALGISEEAAHKRTARAMERLRGFFTKRGLALSAVTLTGIISANAVQAAPAGLTATVASTAAGSATTVSALTLAKGTLHTMNWVQVKFAAGVAVTALVVGGATTLAVSKARQTRQPHSPIFQALLLEERAGAGAKVFTFSGTKDGFGFGTAGNAPLRVQKDALLNGSAIASVMVISNTSGQPVIAFTLTEEAKKRFAEATRTNLNRQLVVAVDGKVLSTPVIRDEIPGGQAQISGNFSPEEAAALVERINNARQH